jgi:hypothetical protein
MKKLNITHANGQLLINPFNISPFDLNALSMDSYFVPQGIYESGKCNYMLFF